MRIKLFLLSDGPDRKTPYEDTLKAVDEEYRKGKFNRFGVSVRPNCAI